MYSLGIEILCVIVNATTSFHETHCCHKASFDLSRVEKTKPPTGKHLVADWYKYIYTTRETDLCMQSVRTPSCTVNLHPESIHAQTCLLAFCVVALKHYKWRWAVLTWHCGRVDCDNTFFTFRLKVKHKPRPNESEMLYERRQGGVRGTLVGTICYWVRIRLSKKADANESLDILLRCYNCFIRCCRISRIFSRTNL